MKTTKLIITFLTLFYTVSASAQFMNAPTAERTTTQTQVQQPRVKKIKTDNPYASRIYISYDMPTFVDTNDSDYTMDYSGFTVGYEYAIPIKQVSNLNVNIGSALSYARYSEEDSSDNDWGSGYEKYEWEGTSNHLSISLPISLSYSVNLRDHIYFTPYFGFAFRYGLMFTDKYSYEESVKYDSGEKYSESYEYKYYNYSGASVGNDNTYNRFNLAYQFGFNFDINKFYVGLNYSRDITETCKDCVYTNLAIRLGVKF